MIFELITLHLRREEVLRLIEAAAIMEVAAVESHDTDSEVEWQGLIAKLCDAIPGFALTQTDIYERRK